MVDQQCRESEGKAKIEGYMSVSDEEAHQRIQMANNSISSTWHCVTVGHYQVLIQGFQS